MPSSAIRQINEISELIYYSQPTKILDIGIGCGKYAFLSREYLDKPYDQEKTFITIHGVEAHSQYLRPIHNLLYDKIFTGDVLDIFNDLDFDYDLVLLVDVIEHFDKEVGLTLIKKLLERTKNLVIATPDGFIEQVEVYDNEYEIHKSGWAKEDFLDFKNKFFVNHDAQLIVYLGTDFLKVRSLFNRSNKFVILKKLFPVIKKPFRFLKSKF